MLFKFFVLLIFSSYVAMMVVLLGRRFFTRSRPLKSPLLSQREPFEGPIVRLVDVSIRFDHPVLKDFNLEIAPGESLGVLGKSGSGKSVLLKLISGLLKPDKGKIYFKGVDISHMGEDELLKIRKEVSYVFQSGAVFDFLDVRENIAYSLREQGVTDDEAIEQRVEYLLDAVEMEGMGDLTSPELSTGSKKQVAIARAIANNPTIILYDEPTTGVDPIIGKSLSRLIRKLNQQEKLTSVVVTHDLKCVEIVSDRIILLKDGLIRFQGSLEAFHQSTDPFVRAFIAGKRYDDEALSATP